MNYTIIGCGRISPNHIASAIKNNLNIVAICDIKKEKMQEAILRHNLNSDVQQYLDYKAILESENIDLIAICTESGKHGRICSILRFFE